MAWDGSQSQEANAWPKSASPLVPLRSMCGSIPRLCSSFSLQVQRDLTQRSYMKRKIIPDKDTQGTHCCKFHELKQILSVVEQWCMDALWQAGS